MLTTVENFSALVVAPCRITVESDFTTYRTIARGKPDARLDNLSQRILRALDCPTQQSVFKKRLVASFLHALVFYGFVFYFSEPRRLLRALLHSRLAVGCGACLTCWLIF
jgi:hypothetical protein